MPKLLKQNAIQDTDQNKKKMVYKKSVLPTSGYETLKKLTESGGRAFLRTWNIEERSF